MSIDELQILRAACCVAGLDGEIDEREREALKVLVDRAGVGKASFEAMLEMAIEKEDYFSQQLDFLRGDVDRTIKTLFRIAVVDGKLGDNERVVMRYFADKLGMAEPRFEQILEAAERESKRAGAK